MFGGACIGIIGAGVRRGRRLGVRMSRPEPAQRDRSGWAGVDAPQAFGAPVPDGDSSDERLRVAQLQLLFERGQVALIGGFPGALLMAWLLLPYNARLDVGVWLGLRFSIGLLRLVASRRFRVSADQADPRWERRFSALLVADGLVWGLLGVWLMPAPGEAAALLLATLVGIATLGAFIGHTRWSSLLQFLLPMLAPTACAELLRGDANGFYAGAALVMFMIILAFEGRRGAQQIAELMRLRLDTDRVASDRAVALAAAQHAAEVKSRFLSTMSHEMRTPLHGILGLTRLLRSELAGPSASRERLLERLNLMERSGEHLLGLVSDVLEASRFDAGPLKLADEPFDLVRLLEDVSTLAAASAAAKGLRVEVDHGGLGSQRWVRGDAVRLRQVLLNLTGNAVKFTERGEVRVTALREEAHRLVIAVHDTGIGVPVDQQERIFDAFHQVESDHDRRYAGSGLGLSISRELARSMGGELSCQSTPGEGSVFRLALHLPPAAAAPESDATLTPEGRALHGRVLVAEDNPVNALVAQALLERLGLEVELVQDGAQAIARCAQVPAPDLVLMDCQMPRVDGLAATRQIRAQEAASGRQRVAIVALTANALREDRHACLEAGMDGHLAKPFRDDELRRLVARHLAKP